MRAITIGFHDLGDAPPRDTPAVMYTIDHRRFSDHVLAIGQQHPLLRTLQDLSPWGADVPVFLTFDDGGAGGYTWGAPALEKQGWRGHFFITTDWIGRSEYMDRRQILDLYQRGHIIGSHSCSHPERMACLPMHEIVREWKESCALLSDLVGAPVLVASVPGGYYSREVAMAAAIAGIKILFTSEPTAATTVVDGCLVLGRYCIQRNTPPQVTGAIAAGNLWPRWRQRILWETKKFLKTLAGESYVTVRRRLLSYLVSEGNSTRQ